MNVCGLWKDVFRASVKGVGMASPAAETVARMSRAVGEARR